MSPNLTLTADRITLLQQMAVFGGLDDAALTCLLAHADYVQVAENAYFFHEGEPGDCMFVLEVGAAEVLKRADDGRLVPLMRQLKVGDCFGEMSLIDLEPRSTSIRALVDCRAFTITPAALHALYALNLEQFTLIQMNLGRELCRRLRAAHLDLKRG